MTSDGFEKLRRYYSDVQIRAAGESMLHLDWYFEVKTSMPTQIYCGELRVLIRVPAQKNYFILSMSGDRVENFGQPCKDIAQVVDTILRDDNAPESVLQRLDLIHALWS